MLEAVLSAWLRDKAVLRAAAGSKPLPPLEWRDEWQARQRERERERWGGGRGSEWKISEFIA